MNSYQCFKNIVHADSSNLKTSDNEKPKKVNHEKNPISFFNVNFEKCYLREKGEGTFYIFSLPNTNSFWKKKLWNKITFTCNLNIFMFIIVYHL